VTIGSFFISLYQNPTVLYSNMPLLTLTSDIGHQDYLVGAIKGQLLQINPGFAIADISHQLSPFNYPQAAYVCRNAFKNFPPYTFHLALINLFERKPEQLLLAYHHEQYLLCADNGLLPMIVEGKPEMIIGLQLDKTSSRNTLYCARVMGQAINDLAGGKSLQEIGVPDVAIVEKNYLRPLLGDNWIEGQIIFIDNFENVIVNITREEFEQQRKGRSFRIVFKRDEVIDRISDSYADVPEGDKLVNKGNAAGLFGLQDFTEQSQNQYLQNRLFYQTVRVYFE
jgi:S-adenosylmethionine hydrolase